MRLETAEEKYLNQVFGLHDSELEAVRAKLIGAGLDFMALSPHEARLLQFLVRGFGVRKVVEIGTLYGYSGLCLLKALPADGHLFTVEKNPANWAIAQETFAGEKRVTSVCGEALSVLAGLEGPFDMVFIDANKGGYAEYLDWAERVVRPGGLIVGDNSYLWGAVWNEPRQPAGVGATRAMKEFNARLADASRYNSILIPTSEGMTIAQKR